MENINRTKCEIWTRVMGYHRPVSQYNFGKKSEFYSRQYFKALANSNNQFINKYSSTVTQESSSVIKLLLFTTNTCPKCPAVKNWLNQANVDYFGIDNNMLNFWEMAEKYNVRSVPTLLALDEDGKELWRASEISEIQQNIN